jgi:FAD/FMN-containing dehydrogenase
MLDRRDFLKAAALLPAACATVTRPEGAWVNDIHSQLNRTWVAQVRKPGSVDELRDAVRSTRGPLCTSAGRHAMGGQQFATDATLLDMNGMRRVTSFDRERGIIEVEAGIQWPELIHATRDSQWGIRQKQTGADRLSIGGALAANVHGRGLTMKPFVDDVESFVLIDADGEALECSRTTNRELFARAIGGYGLFGVIASVRLRLDRRRKLQRVVEEQRIDTVVSAFESRIADGFTYGDFQFSIDSASDTFLQRGVFSCYKPVADDTPIAAQAELKPEDWMRLLYLAHAKKEDAYRAYVSYYLSTNGQVYWSDEHQLSFYPDDYHRTLDPLLQTPPATEMISELYVPREKLAGFMTTAAEELRRRKAEVIYGTVRLIEHDDETMLAWAKQRYACVIFNLHTPHDAASLAQTADTFRALIDLALERDGSYYLTYHRWARREQVDAAYPQMRAFLRDKQNADPRGRFQSEWYRHAQTLYA